MHRPSVLLLNNSLDVNKVRGHYQLLQLYTVDAINLHCKCKSDRCVQYPQLCIGSAPDCVTIYNCHVVLLICHHIVVIGIQIERSQTDL